MRLQEYLLSHDNLLDAEVNRDDIISALGTNKNTLTDAVKAVTGKSPMEYMRILKVEEAQADGRPSRIDHRGGGFQLWF